MMASHGRLFTALALAIPLLGSCAVVSTTFGAGNTLHAIHRANVPLVLSAVSIGALIEGIRARRAAILLSQDRRITFGQSFTTMMLSYGAGHILPFAPTTLALRAWLTNRVVGIRIPFATGVFLACSVLDALALLPLLIFLLLAAPLPKWERVALCGMLAQSALFLLAPLLSAALARRFGREQTHRPWMERLLRLMEGAAAGLGTVVRGGWWPAIQAVGLSFLSAALGMARLAFLVRAFGLAPTHNQLYLLMSLGSFVGNLPIQVPGAGTWTALALLHVVGIGGSGLGGYVLLSRFIDAVESPALAIGALAVWVGAKRPGRERLKEMWSDGPSRLRELAGELSSANPVKAADAGRAVLALVPAEARNETCTPQQGNRGLDERRISRAGHAAGGAACPPGRWL
jgi:uncharacterized membrane protein YbhN (UPF0104 family)